MLVTLLLLLPFITAVSAKDPISVNIAAAYDSEINDGWARYVYFQRPDGQIMIRARWDNVAEPINGPVTPREDTPLAAYYRSSREGKGDDLVVSYLDKSGQIIHVSCRHEDNRYTDWATTPTDYKPASGLALADTDYRVRRLYIDDQDFVVQAMDGKETALLERTATRGSQVAATVPVGSSDIHVFFVSKDMSLSSLTFNGSQWSEVLPPIPGFTSDPGVHFAAASWSDPFQVEIFYINPDRHASKWTFDGDSWVNTSSALRGAKGVKAGGPVAASRSADGSGRYAEYFYTADRGQINYSAKNSADKEVFFQIAFQTFEDPQPEPSLSKDQKIAIGVPLGLGLPGILAGVGAFFWRRWKKRRGKADPDGLTQ